MNFYVYIYKHSSSGPLLVRLTTLSEPLINNLTCSALSQHSTQTRRQAGTHGKLIQK